MLDDVTKKRINSLRQILVGKLPDPKAQVEQITNGLIYKFMNDMDEQSVSMGGKSTYFSGKFQKYSWKNLLDTKTSGVEKIKLYSEAIEQMYTNENLPELFREIFKNSFLPFKDPSTLNMFLKEINEFHYSNSEKLGDAFEYLLSFMGSQGDAGQFRTPRHIIDFITEIVNPQKNESVLDPACGTAGFLISAYKHILKQNTKKNLGDGLNASDRKKIGENLNGYDISPDMVKMSLVNMYLHKFTNPKINEYDTLSSEDRWNEYYDVILANPPFFSPKGGVTPHNRFGVNSTRAEVLFIDYINEHLKPKGRAGIIVPEGIIFQKGATYVQLRKKLIETSLVGVVSLPSGIFNPYANVKTSILILDKQKAKDNKFIYFANIENDGFDLGSQRRKADKNDIPKVLSSFLNIFNNKDINENIENIFPIEKKLLLSNSIISFNFNEYLKEEDKKLEFKLCELNELVNIKYGTRIVKKNAENGQYPVYGGGNKTFYTNKYNRENELIIARFGISENCVRFVRDKFFLNDSGFSLEIKDKTLKPKYLNKILLNLQQKIYKCGRGVAQKNLNINEFLKIKIPLPSVEIQNQIFEELDSYQKIIDGCRQVIENYKPSIDIDPSWEMVELGDIADFQNGFAFESKDFIKDGIQLIKIGNIKKNHFDYLNKPSYLPTDYKKKYKKFIILNNDILISMTGTTGKNDYGFVCKVNSGEYLLNQRVGKISIKNQDKILKDFLYFYLISQKFHSDVIKNSSGGVRQANVSGQNILKIQIPIPKINIQKDTIIKFNENLDFIELSKKIIIQNERLIKEKISKIWSD